MSSASSVLCFRRRPCDLRGTIVDIGAGTCNCGALLGSHCAATTRYVALIHRVICAHCSILNVGDEGVALPTGRVPAAARGSSAGTTCFFWITGQAKVCERNDTLCPFGHALPRREKGCRRTFVAPQERRTPTNSDR